MAVTRRRPRIAELARDERGVMNIRDRLHGDNIRDRLHGDEEGQAVVNVVVLVIVIGAALLSAYLLWRTMDTALDIATKADTIAETGRGINIATDSVIQLSRVNRSAASILETAQPLDEQLAAIVEEANSINALAQSINGTAGTINSTAETINGTAGQINSTAGTINTSATSIRGSASQINQLGAAIFDVARRIDTDVALINRNLDGTIGIANDIKGDSGNILREAVEAHDTAACIDEKLTILGLLGSTDGHCENRPS